jgi:PKD repeat protein
MNLADGTDLDGEPWASPPSVGCDEVVESGITGPLQVSVSSSLTSIAERGSAYLTGSVAGRASRIGWDYGDGSLLTNQSVFVTSHIWTNAGYYEVSFTAWNADHPDGVSTNLTLQVVPLVPPEIENPTMTNQSFLLSFQGQPGVRYYVEQATNLVPPVVWTAVQSVFSTGQVMQVTDTAATNDMRFYRVRVP